METSTNTENSKNNKKIPITRELKLALTIILSGLLLFSAVFTVRSLLEKKTIEEKTVLYTGKQLGSIGYQIKLKPNPIYEDRYLKEGGKYMTQIVESIPMNLSYKYTGSTEAELTVQYNVTAVIESFEQSDGEEKVLWSKKYVIFPDIKQPGNTNIEINKNIDIKLNDYNSFFENVVKQYKIVSKARLIVYFNVSIEARSVNATYRESICPYAVIPLLENYFEVSGKLSYKKDGSIEDKKNVVIPVNTKMIVLFGTLTGLFIIVLLMLAIFTRIKFNLQGSSKKTQTILQKHRGRIVTTLESNSRFIVNAIKVQTFDDLLRASDELGKPILYPVDSTNDFFIISEEVNYMYTISENE